MFSFKLWDPVTRETGPSRGVPPVALVGLADEQLVTGWVCHHAIRFLDACNRCFPFLGAMKKNLTPKIGSSAVHRSQEMKATDWFVFWDLHIPLF